MEYNKCIITLGYDAKTKCYIVFISHSSCWRSVYGIGIELFEYVLIDLTQCSQVLPNFLRQA